jgi:putative Mg2+ transporter-C (MgtC) family protein
VDTEVLVRLAIAALLGAAVGLEREAAGQAAGLRTHAMVAIGACLFGIVSTLGFEEFFAPRDTTNVNVDVTRVASNVVVGIGFIGAGLIFRQGGHVRNLTTAASLWVTAAIGLAAGVGDGAAAAVTTLALVATLLLLRPVRAMIEERLAKPRRRVTVQLRAGADPGGVLTELADHPGVTVRDLVMLKEDGCPVVRAILVGRPGTDLRNVVSAVSQRDEVENVTDTAEE